MPLFIAPLWWLLHLTTNSQSLLIRCLWGYTDDAYLFLFWEVWFRQSASPLRTVLQSEKKFAKVWRRWRWRSCSSCHRWLTIDSHQSLILKEAQASHFLPFLSILQSVSQSVCLSLCLSLFVKLFSSFFPLKLINFFNAGIKSFQPYKSGKVTLVGPHWKKYPSQMYKRFLGYGMILGNTYSALFVKLYLRLTSFLMFWFRRCFAYVEWTTDLLVWPNPNQLNRRSSIHTMKVPPIK